MTYRVQLHVLLLAHSCIVQRLLCDVSQFYPGQLRLAGVGR